MSETDRTAPEAESRYHRYIGNHIPWYVHLIWVLFWFLAIAYALRYFVPALQQEFLSPPP
jgi:hypothetical protein